MSYSTIKPKIGFCIDCEQERPLTAGRCNTCYWQHIRLRSANKAQNQGEDKNSIIVNPPDFRARKPIRSANGDLSKWFDERRKEMAGVCCNCGSSSNKFNDAFFRFSVAHILPKSRTSGFPSVATHPKNWIELCIDCHTLYDRNWMTAVKMECFSLAKNKFKSFEPDIAQEERRRIPECLLS